MNIQEPDRTKITEKQWLQVKEHFDDTLDAYKELIGVPGVDVTTAISTVFDPLLKQYEKGERSQQLYSAMLAVK